MGTARRFALAAITLGIAAGSTATLTESPAHTTVSESTTLLYSRTTLVYAIDNPSPSKIPPLRCAPGETCSELLVADNHNGTCTMILRTKGEPTSRSRFRCRQGFTRLLRKLPNG
jgi:hypothetical protein